MREITVQEFKHALQLGSSDDSLDFINVCSPGEYEEKHIQGVRSVPLDTLHKHIDEFKKKKMIYVHCRSGNRSRQAIETLKDAGIPAELINVSGGLMAWTKANFPTVSLTHRMPLMQQVLLTAGLLTATSIILSLLVESAFVFIALFVGLGQIFAGLTGWCGLSRLLEKMPWNK